MVRKKNNPRYKKVKITNIQGERQTVYKLKKPSERRPPKEFMTRCTRKVKGVRDPGAVCASRYKKLSPSKKRKWEEKRRKRELKEKG